MTSCPVRVPPVRQHAKQLASLQRGVQAAEERAARVADWQARTEAAHADLAASADALAAASSGIRVAVNTLEATQQRTTSALAAMLGRSVVWTDIVFYGGVLAFSALCACIDAARSAAAPLAGAAVLALAVERGLMTAAARWAMVCAVSCCAALFRHGSCMHIVSYVLADVHVPKFDVFADHQYCTALIVH